jgi:predicted NUDIX family NTP pyrophosphohydrolase
MSRSAPRRVAVRAAWSVLLLLAMAPSPSFALSFDRTVLPAGQTPWSVAAGEFNGDSDPDLAVSNLDSHDVSILLGGPGATFTGPTTVPAGADPLGIAAGDFNGDSDPDLAVANNLSRTVSILLGEPGGGFSGPTAFAAGGGPESVAVGEFNGDSDPDLAVANRFTDNVSVLLGGVGGSFSFRVNYAVGADPLGVVAADFNGDSDPDLAVTNHHAPPDNITILEGQADGTFGNATQVTAGQRPVGIVAGEFNGDSDPDLVVANFLGPGASVLLGTAGAGFTAPTNYPAHAGPHGIAIGELNGDSDPDLAVANATGGNVSILLGSTGSSFVDAGDFAVAPGARSVVSGDFNQDGRGDLALATNDGVVILAGVEAPSISIGDVTRAEGDAGDTDFTFTVSASGPSSDPMTVTYRTADGTAVAGSDYADLPPQPLNFAPHETSKTVTVKVHGDLASELEEHFEVLLSDPVNAQIADGAGVGTIVDDDPGGFVRPRGASPLRAALVLAYSPCTSADRTHGPPLAFPSCNPPEQTSAELTVGTADANGPAANSIGSVRVSTLAGDPSTPADEADMRIATSITDVRRRVDLEDYEGEVQVVLTARLTDRLAAGNEPQTTEDFPFRVTVPCAATGAGTIGSACALTTTADSLVPGAVPEGKRSVWALDAVEVTDGGADSDADTLAGNALFATQGLFIP